ncbi:FeoC-like transcriptional regulator [Sporosarcina aquimarina]|uniref:TIGR03826 family flagellar region protein n=1 Tax=Sporosarcina aquimarina TaxID=114975 RepID=UPI00203FACBA|nr:TIGR03826 family flagellar region protein [Sporosarcina aquimarina]MCM3756428.1 FeoC-like transcriptional regulator [Sporosarcina aquimarina]
MAELRHCPSCGDFFNYTGVRDVCGKCGMNEERVYEEVYRFLRKRENRAATIERIVEMTEATESMLHKWVRKGRLQPALFPNLGYPCDNCGKLTSKGKLCDECTADLKQDLKTFEAATEFREAIQQKEQSTYLSERKK